MKEGDEAKKALDELRRRMTARRDLSSADGFQEVSPRVGELDAAAFDDLLDRDGDAALSLLARLTGAADEELRAMARRLAGRVLLRLAGGGKADARGIGRVVRATLDVGRDLDVEASIDVLAPAVALRAAPALDELRATAWARPSTALCLVIDRSGSMTGERLAAAALTAAVVALRAEDDFSVVAFSSDALVLKSQDVRRDAEDVVGDVLALRGHGPTDIGLALREAQSQLSRSRASRRVTLLLSDCRATAGGDGVASARSVERLLVLAPAEDSDDARRFASAAGAEIAVVEGPASVPAALAAVLSA